MTEAEILQAMKAAQPSWKKASASAPVRPAHLMGAAPERKGVFPDPSPSEGGGAGVPPGYAGILMRGVRLDIDTGNLTAGTFRFLAQQVS